MEMDRGLKTACDEILLSTYEQVSHLFSELYPSTIEVINKKNAQFQVHLKEMLEFMVSDLVKKKNTLGEELDERKEEIRRTQQELGLPINIPVFDGSLTEELKKLKSSFKELGELRERRMERMTDLFNEMIKMTCQLEAEALERPGTLTTEDLDIFEEKVSRLRKELSKRRNTYKSQRATIETLFTRLACLPSTEYEQTLFNSSEETFPLSKYSLEKLSSFLEKLKEKHLGHSLQFETLSDQLTLMWGKILLEANEQANFREGLTDIGDSTLQKMKEEIFRCEQVRKSQLEPLLKRQREKISKLWEELTFGEEERQDFALFFSAAVSEEILEAHETESRRLENLLRDSRELLQLATKRFEMWTRRLQLEEAATDKNRFHNRGGQLLMEEKERKSIEVNLPKVEEKIYRLSQLFEEQHNTPFKWHGKPLMSRIQDDWEDYNRQKEFKKQLRKVDQLHLPSPKRPVSASNMGSKNKRLKTTDIKTPMLVKNRTFTLTEGDSSRRKPLSELNSPVASTPSH